jgi:hypothetical protein
MGTIFIIVKWFFILVTVLGVFRFLSWIMGDIDLSEKGFLEDYFHPVYNSVETFFWIVLPALVVLGFAVASEV